MDVMSYVQKSQRILSIKRMLDKLYHNPPIYSMLHENIAHNGAIHGNAVHSMTGRREGETEWDALGSGYLERRLEMQIVLKMSCQSSRDNNDWKWYTFQLKYGTLFN